MFYLPISVFQHKKDKILDLSSLKYFFVPVVFYAIISYLIFAKGQKHKTRFFVLAGELCVITVYCFLFSVILAISYEAKYYDKTIEADLKRYKTYRMNIFYALMCPIFFDLIGISLISGFIWTICLVSVYNYHISNMNKSKEK